MKATLIAAAIAAGLTVTSVANADDNCAMTESENNLKLVNDTITLYTLTKIAEDMKTIRELLEASAIHPDRTADLLNRREADVKKVQMVRADRDRVRIENAK